MMKEQIAEDRLRFKSTSEKAFVMQVTEVLETLGFTYEDVIGYGSA